MTIGRLSISAAGAVPQITIIQAESDQADVALNPLACFLAEERFDTLAGQLPVNLLGIHARCDLTGDAAVRSAEFGLIFEIRDLYLRPVAHL